MAFPSVVKLSTFICILLVLLLNVNTAIVQAHPSIEARRTLNLPSQKNVSQSAIDGARKLIRQVLVEVGAHNKKLNENPRRNIYMTRNAAAQKHRRRDGISAPLTVNTTVTAAAALLAEVDAAGAASVGNLTIRSNEERDSTFWMETISHSGTMPFGNDPGYKVRLPDVLETLQTFTVFRVGAVLTLHCAGLSKCQRLRCTRRRSY